ncbi:MAG: nuclear transport factor 2 family protein [Candidatus Solibacter usitatus]|nr:nuclear transport factor 2 family protein [Candidatus Solibacter usitatus]
MSVDTFAEMANAVNAGDARRYAALYAQDAVITIYGGEVLKGRDAIETHEVDLLRQFPGARLAFYEIWRDGEAAVVHYGVNGQTSSGKSMGHEGLLFYRFHASGLIAKERRYFDSLTPMAQLGALGPVAARPVPQLASGTKLHVAAGSAQERENVSAIPASFTSMLSPDVVVDDRSLPQSLSGRANATAWFLKWPTVETTNVQGNGDFVLLETLIRAGGKFAVHRALIVQMKNGKIANISAFMNGKELAESLGQWPPPPR